MDAATPLTRRHEPDESHGYGVPMGENELNLGELLRTLWRRRWIVVGTMLLLTGLTVLVVVQLTPRYVATTRVMIDARQQRVVNIENVVSGVNPDAAMVESEVEVLTSRTLASRVVDELKLDEDPEFNPKLKPADSVWSSLRPSAWLPQSWLALLSPADRQKQPLGAVDQKDLDRAAVIDAFLSRLTVKPVGRSFVMDISFVSQDPFKAARIANKVADLYLVSQLEAKFEATARANAWLSDRLKTLREQVEASERAVVAYRKKYNIADTEKNDVSSQQVSELNTQLTMARADRAAAEARLSQVRDLVNRGGADSAAQVLQSALIQNLRGQEAELQRKLSELLTRYGERHPRIVNARAEIADLRNSIAREVRKIVQNLENEVEVAKARENALQKDLQGLKAESNDSRSAEIGLSQLQREAEANRTLYETFLNRFKETSEQQDIQQPDARVISRADVPLAPSYPRKTLIVGLAFGASLLLGIALVVLVERLDNGFRTGEQIRLAAGLATLALVPTQGGGRRRARPDRVLIDKPASQFAESMRTLLAGVLLSDIDEPPRSVLVTSSVPGEGKTVTSLSLARVAALGGKRTLLVDCDVRRPTMSKLVHPVDADPRQSLPGLTDVLTDRAKLHEAVFVDPATGLHVLLSGSRVPNPQDLLQSKTFGRILEQLVEAYELVVLDSAPVLAVADPLILGALADRTVFVTQWEKTPRQVALAALRQLVQAKAHLAGVVLSQVNVRRHSKYGFGDYGYYYGRYREYYQE
ncbi:GumC family protein [Tistlia consotensis]|nr:polysaccharide biosynthesis tyrosine autokinase [Tistlia consotensis]